MDQEGSPKSDLSKFVSKHLTKEHDTKEERKQSKISQIALKPLQVSAFARWVCGSSTPIVSLTEFCHLMPCQSPNAIALRLTNLQWGRARAGHLLAGVWNWPRLLFFQEGFSCPNPQYLFSPITLPLARHFPPYALPFLLLFGILLKTCCKLGNTFGGQYKIWRCVNIGNRITR